MRTRRPSVARDTSRMLASCRIERVQSSLRAAATADARSPRRTNPRPPAQRRIPRRPGGRGPAAKVTKQNPPPYVCVSLKLNYGSRILKILLKKKKKKNPITRTPLPGGVGTLLRSMLPHSPVWDRSRGGIRKDSRHRTNVREHGPWGARPGTADADTVAQQPKSRAPLGSCSHTRRRATPRNAPITQDQGRLTGFARTASKKNCRASKDFHVHFHQ